MHRFGFAVSGIGTTKHETGKTKTQEGKAKTQAGMTSVQINGEVHEKK